MQQMNKEIHLQLEQVEKRNQEILALFVRQSHDIDHLYRKLHEKCLVNDEQFDLPGTGKENVPAKSKYYIWENIGCGG